MILRVNTIDFVGWLNGLGAAGHPSCFWHPLNSGIVGHVEKP
jgi:hypothetical protein